MNYSKRIVSRKIGLVAMLALAGLVWLGLGTSIGTSQCYGKDEPEKKEILGYTLPADLKAVELRFRASGIVKTVDIKEGDTVEAGKPLMTLDDSSELIELAGLKEDVNDNRTEYARVSHEAKVAEFNRQKELRAKDAGSAADYEKAEAEVKMALHQITQEEIDKRVKAAKMRQKELEIEKMKLTSPLAGTVMSVDARPGEMVDPSKPPVVTIVNNKTLVVESNIEIARTEKLKIGQEVKVSYDKKYWIPAKVSFLSPMVDAASGLQKVHLTMDNADAKPSGYQVYVDIP